MCFSARVQQNLYSLSRRFGAVVDWPLFEDLFRQRLAEPSAKIARGLEANFIRRDADETRDSQALIAAHRKAQASIWEQDLFKQRKRLADAQRKLATKQTKAALNDERIATNKIKDYIDRLSDLSRTEPRPNDDRIFPMWYAPVILQDEGQPWIRPMRYTCRLEGKPANYDERYPGTYNAFGAFLTVN